MHEPQLFLHTSNRMEDLAAMLAALLRRRATGDPFEAETVLVQTQGMGRWLSLQLAEAQGICLNVRFPFPKDVVEEVLAGLLPDWQGAGFFRRETMIWRIFRILNQFLDDKRFAAIRHYLEDGDVLKRVQLADRLGNLFDQYLVYRPDWLLGWEQQETDDWQGILWRRLAEEGRDARHFGHAQAALEKMEKRPPQSFTDLPARLCLFGISSLPPLFLQVLRNYARHGELHLFLLQPTDQYWGDLVSKTAQARVEGSGAASPACYLEEGHPLVASLGRQGQDLLNLLIDQDFQQSDERENFREASGTSLLHQLQNDILRLIDRGHGADGKIRIGRADESILVHSCHSPMREVEVLHDQLLDLFKKDKTLNPRDVLVMIPEIESYAPYIQAVFNSEEDQRSRIPFSVVDRRPRSAFHAIDAWFRLLELATSRFSARDVVALLETPPFRARFALTDRDVNCLRAWIQSTGIRWGIDAAHREEEGLPPVSETSWQNGIDQWLLGYAMREEEAGAASEFSGIFPFGEIEGSNIELLNLFLGALDFFFQTHKALREPRPITAWCDTFTDLLEKLYGGVDEVAYEADSLRSALAALRQNASAAAVDDPLPLEPVRHFIEKSIDATVSGGGFLSGGVTFCALQPMRTIPARVICLLGMDDDAFPRRPPQLGFDRMRDERRIGDRSVREDDRYLFLETVLSARETLVLSFVGQSPRDLSDAPPSVLVSELLDHLDRSCAFPDGLSARAFVVRRHRLQPFHPDYFQGDRLFSYSAENARACQRLMGEQSEFPPFVQAKLSEPEPEWRTVTVQQLVRFFRNPAEYFVKERVGLHLPREEAMLEDAEMFSVNSLIGYNLKRNAVDGLIAHRESHEWQRLQARGEVPLGTPGLARCHSVQRDAEKFVARLSEVIDEPQATANRQVDLHLGSFHLRGEVGAFAGDRLIVYRPAKLKPKDRVAAWILHLTASCMSLRDPQSAPTATLLIGEDFVVTLPPRHDAEALLGQLLRFYWRGLDEPLPFFPESAWEYATVVREKGGEVAAQKAWTRFSGDGFGGGFGPEGEIENPYVKLCWGGRMSLALDEEFVELSNAIFCEPEFFGGGDPAR